MQYTDHVAHYAIDARDMPLPDELGPIRAASERRRWEVVAGLIPRDARRVLEVGCGTGAISALLAVRGHEVIGADLGFDSIQRGAARFGNPGRLSFVQADTYRLPFADGVFDAVVASEVIEHLHAPGDALREIARVVRPGGAVVLSTPYREKLHFTLCIHCNTHTPINAHLHSFDERSVGKLLADAGCTVERDIRFACRVAEHLGLPFFTGALPHALWRIMDAGAGKLFGRQSFIALRSKRD